MYGSAGDFLLEKRGRNGDLGDLGDFMDDLWVSMAPESAPAESANGCRFSLRAMISPGTVLAPLGRQEVGEIQPVGLGD